MNILSCRVKLNAFETSIQKRVNITYAAISPHCLFSLRYQHQVINIMRLIMVQIIFPYQFTWVNEPLNTA